MPRALRLAELHDLQDRVDVPDQEVRAARTHEIRLVDVGVQPFDRRTGQGEVSQAIVRPCCAAIRTDLPEVDRDRVARLGPFYIDGSHHGIAWLSPLQV